MNIGFYLLPKKDVKFIDPDSTIRQVLEKMAFHKYTAVPLVDNDGKYAGTLTEGDILWKLKEAFDKKDYEEVMKTKLYQVPQRIKNVPISIHAEMTNLITLAIDQNFVPVIDDNDHFIGIVRRRDIIKFCSSLLKEKGEQDSQPTKEEPEID
jgi:CBS domain-containing protein